MRRIPRHHARGTRLPTWTRQGQMERPERQDQGSKGPSWCRQEPPGLYDIDQPCCTSDTGAAANHAVSRGDNLLTGAAPVSSAHESIKVARLSIRQDLEDRWVTNLNEERKSFFLIASLLDPHTKSLSFCDDKQFPHRVNARVTVF
jgi:hypothetical protein